MGTGTVVTDKKKSPIEVKPLNKAEIAHFYGRQKIRDAIVEFSKNREVAGRTEEGAYGKRPCVINYASDLEEMLASGMVSFHASVERWKNPTRISTGMKRSELDAIRSGWDFVIDIDCEFLDHSKIAAELLCKALHAWSVENIAVKFSGRSGFHILVPFESFPETFNGKKTKDLFPEAPRIIASFLKDEISEELARRFQEEEGSISGFAEKVGKNISEVSIPSGKKGELNPYAALSIDTLLMSSRHLFRMPYSLHEKSWLVSLPLRRTEDIESFDPESARPERIVEVVPFLQVMPNCRNEAESLISRAYSYEAEKSAIRDKAKSHYLTTGGAGMVAKEHEALTAPIPPEAFPPCIRKIADEGLQDGRKRAEFVLRTFLRRGGWSWDEIEKFLTEWNKKNKEPLNERQLLAGCSWQKRQGEREILMPPNCDAPSYYKDLGVCVPGPLCGNAKNPFNVAMRALKRRREEAEDAERRAKKNKGGGNRNAADSTVKDGKTTVQKKKPQKRDGIVLIETRGY